ncbi:MAG: SpoIIE family protein phosphatase [Chloroflexaceae bacterium]|nr:SpoIIE family protein phosphatase [Chloroflexaceae bacterium]
MAPIHSNQRVAELTTLNALAHTLNKAADLRDVLEGSLEHILELMELQTGWIFMYDEGETFTLAARHNLPPAISYPGKGWGGDCRCHELCLEGKLDQRVNIVRCTRLRAAIGDKWGLSQHASVALRNGDELIGILNVATTEWGDLQPAKLQLLMAVGSMLSTAIVRTRLHEQVKIRRVQEQAALLKLSQELLVADNLEPALYRLVRVGARLLEADACAFIEADEEGGRALLRAAYGWKLPDECPWPLVLDPETPHLWYLPDAATNISEEAYSTLPRLLRDQHFIGHVAVSLEVGGVPIGTLMANTHSTRRFLEDEVQLLGLLGSQLVQTLERERLYQEALERRSLERELELARDIQSSFLPNRAPQVPGYAISAFYEPARQIGGDFFDFVQTNEPESCLGIVIADVTDKGVPAALFMALSRTLLRATAIDGRPPAAVLEKTNRLILADSRAGLFVTCFYALLNPRQHLITYANGGHNYPLLYRAATGDVESARAKGIVLGVIPQPQFEEQQITIAPGDVLLLYTDGITEAMDSERNMFGEERLGLLLLEHHHRHPREIIERVLSAVAEFVGDEAQSDDMTMVVLKRV